MIHVLYSLYSKICYYVICIDYVESLAKYSVYQRNKIIFTHVRASIYILFLRSFIPNFWIKQTRFNENLKFALRRFTVKSLRTDLRTISGITHAHHSCGRKQGKLSGSRLSYHLQIRINTVFRYVDVRWIFPHFLDKIK